MRAYDLVRYGLIALTVISIVSGIALIIAGFVFMPPADKPDEKPKDRQPADPNCQCIDSGRLIERLRRVARDLIQGLVWTTIIVGIPSDLIVLYGSYKHHYMTLCIMACIGLGLSLGLGIFVCPTLWLMFIQAVMIKEGSSQRMAGRPSQLGGPTEPV